MTYVELGADNGGILLNLSEGGFAVQSALALPSRDFPTLRFQVPHVQGWLTASGKIAWISESKKEAGIQFTELPGASRSEICKWVAVEEQPQSAAINVAQETEDTKGDISNAPERVDAQRPAQILYHARTPGRREALPLVPLTALPEPQHSVVVAPRQDFHFTDYSMFAPAQDDRAAWIKPEKKGMGWGGFTLLALLLSALFFALGATVGRGTIDQWIAYVTGSSEPPTTPVEAPSIEAADNSTPQPDSGTNASAEQQASSSAASTPLPPENSGSSTTAESQTPSQPEARKLQDQPDRSEAVSETSKRKSANGTAKESVQKNSGFAARGGRSVESYAQNAAPRSYDDTNADAGPVPNPNEHAILVNAPAPGSPPFFVNLSNETVSASSTVAISAQHSILIAPHAASYERAQRVVIGKLVSHSHPFYPADARSKRIQGSVLLRVMVGRTGQVIGVTPVRGPNELVNASVAAVREWRYEPTYVDGDPAETQADVTFVFRLP